MYSDAPVHGYSPRFRNVFNSVFIAQYLIRIVALKRLKNLGAVHSVVTSYSRG